MCKGIGKILTQTRYDSFKISFFIQIFENVVKSLKITEFIFNLAKGDILN